MSTHQNLARRILDWLRAGYPDGVPVSDHVALMGLLHRNLSDSEVEAVADRLAADPAGPLSRAEVGAAITRLAHEKPSDADIDRVSSHLVAAGIGMARERSADSPTGA